MDAQQAERIARGHLGDRVDRVEPAGEGWLVWLTPPADGLARRGGSTYVVESDSGCLLAFPSVVPPGRVRSSWADVRHLAVTVTDGA